jgi:hypothetical protein
MTARTRRDVMKPSRHADRCTGPTPLRDEQLREVVGGRKAGKCQEDYSRYVMKDALLGSFAPGH